MTNEEANEIIGERVGYFRNKLNLSFSELARRCSVGNWTCYPAAVSEIEKGQHTPSAAMLARLVIALNLKSLDDLLPLNRRKIKLRKQA